MSGYINIMKNTYNKYKLFLWALIGTVLLTLNLTILNYSIIGIFGLLLYVISIGIWISKLLEQKFIFGFLSLLSGIILLTTASYYIFGITKLTSFIMLFIPLSLFLLKTNKKFEFNFHFFKNIKFTRLPAQSGKEFFLISFFLILELILTGFLIAKKTTSLMPSPWSAVNPWFFILYTLTTGMLFYIVYKSKSITTQIVLTSIHIFTTFAVTAILYPLGWGFDAYVHRATEVWIYNFGSITPKQPYYIGQYSLVVWIAHLTKIPLFYIDVYLVPLLASLTIPATIIYSLKKAWNIEPKYSAIFVWIIPFIPFLSLHLTTPHNVVLLFSILLVFIVLGYLKGEISWHTPFLLSVAAISTHPLVGAPIFIFTLTAILIKKYKRRAGILILISLLLLTLSLPLMFILNNLRVGAGFPEFSNPLLRISHFFELFARPYWYAKNTPLIFELLYFWQRLLVPVVVITGIVGFARFCHLERSPKGAVERSVTGSNKNIYLYFLYPVSAFGFILSAWLLRSWVTFPDVVSYEQGDFPLRLVKASILFLLPFTIYYLLFTFKKIESLKRRKLYLGSILILISILLMLSFYLSYPQRNPKARFPGLNITQSDFKAVEYIHDQNEEYDYVVLSNQLVSAAALTNYSFAKYFDTPNGELFYYSVPTGGLLYKQYGKMLYEGQKREYMTDAMDLVGVEKSYFILNSYWANANQIIEGAKQTADSWEVIDNGAVWVFVYSLPQS